MKEREKKEKKIAKEKALEEKRLAKEQAKMTKEFDKIDLDTKFNEEVNKKIEEKKKNPLNWESPK